MVTTVHTDDYSMGTISKTSQIFSSKDLTKTVFLSLTVVMDNVFIQFSVNQGSNTKK